MIVQGTIALGAGALAFLITLVLTPYLGRRLLAWGITGIDVNKESKPKVPEEGGIAILLAFALTYPLLVYDSKLFLAYAAVLLIGLFGFLDRIHGFKPRVKLAVPILIGTLLVPLANPELRFVGNIGLMAMAVTVVSFAVVSNITNMLAGFNGLEVGLGLIASGGFAAYCWLVGANAAFCLSFILFCSLVAFFPYNRYPAKIFPGDSGTMAIGAVLAAAAAIDGLWVPLLVALLPHVTDTALKFYSAGVMSRSQFRPAKLHKGRLYPPAVTYLSVCRLLLLHRPMTEQELVFRVHAFGLLSAILLVLMGIFL